DLRFEISDLARARSAADEQCRAQRDSQDSFHGGTSFRKILTRLGGAYRDSGPKPALERAEIRFVDFEKAATEEHAPAPLVANEIERIDQRLNRELVAVAEDYVSPPYFPRLIRTVVGNFGDRREPLIGPWGIENNAIASRQPLQPRFVIFRESAGNSILNVSPRDGADPKAHTSSFVRTGDLACPDRQDCLSSTEAPSESLQRQIFYVV